MMCSNLAKSPAFPLAIRVSSQPKSFKLFSTAKLESLPIGSVKSRILGLCNVDNSRIVSPCGSWLKSSAGHSFWMKRRSFSDSSVEKVDGKIHLPWLASKEDNNKVSTEKEEFSKGSRSSWEESAEKLAKVSIVRSSWEDSAKRVAKANFKPSRNRLDRESNKSSWDKPSMRFDAEGGKSSRDEFNRRRDSAVVGSRENRNRNVDVVEDHQRNYISEDKGLEGNDEEEEQEGDKTEVVGDSRWDRIKSRYDKVSRFERPEFLNWNKQENWGKKTWKEAVESSVPKLVGEGVYGVGPVLAALTAGRREFYALYVQEGLDLSNNNRKKKDKRGFEKIMKMAEKLGVTINQVSKHALNVLVDNRPHQGLVLDASQLEMVKIKQLDPIYHAEEKKSIWVALDEVTDPQNLGAIIRSAYFFGASGVVLCAKNSAPLSGVVSKASAGSLELMELRSCKNMMQFLIFSSENGWRVLGGSVSSKAVPVNEVAPGVPTILVLGSEGFGLRPLVEGSCTQLVRIPSNVPVDLEPYECAEGAAEVAERNSTVDFRSFLAVESLNVSVAAGILLHHLIGDKYYTGEIDQSTSTVELDSNI